MEFYLFFDGEVLPVATMPDRAYYNAAGVNTYDDPNPARAPVWWSD